MHGRAQRGAKSFNSCARRMSTIEVVTLPGGSAKISIQTREHCPPHATCRDTAGQWVVRISFSFTDQTAVGPLSVIPTKRNPGARVVNILMSAAQRNLRACGRLWGAHLQNNPLAQAEGACC